jgi:hypothetical protein
MRLAWLVNPSHALDLLTPVLKLSVSASLAAGSIFMSYRGRQQLLSICLPKPIRMPVSQLPPALRKSGVTRDAIPTLQGCPEAGDGLPPGTAGRVSPPLFWGSSRRIATPCFVISS